MRANWSVTSARPTPRATNSQARFVSLLDLGVSASFGGHLLVQATGSGLLGGGTSDAPVLGARRATSDVPALGALHSRTPRYSGWWFARPRPPPSPVMSAEGDPERVGVAATGKTAASAGGLRVTLPRAGGLSASDRLQPVTPSGEAQDAPFQLPARRHVSWFARYRNPERLSSPAEAKQVVIMRSPTQAAGAALAVSEPLANLKPSTAQDMLTVLFWRRPRFTPQTVGCQNLSVYAPEAAAPSATPRATPRARPWRPRRPAQEESSAVPQFASWCPPLASIRPHEAGRARGWVTPSIEGPPDTSPYAFDPSSGRLSHIFDSIGSFVDMAVPEGTKTKDRLAWFRWCAFCKLVTAGGISPWRTDKAANSGEDPVGHDRESRLLSAFLIYCREVILPRSGSDKASKPTSAYNMVAGVRRIHKRRNIIMVNCTQLAAVLKGLMAEHVEEHGYESLLPHRKEPLDAQHVRDFLSTPKGTKLGRAVVDWQSPLFMSLGALFTVGISTGIRKAEGATPNNRSLDQRRLRRTNLLWRFDGVSVADPTAAQLRGMVAGRDGAILIPPPSKADQTGEIWGVHPIHLAYDPSDRANAATWLRDLELNFPVTGSLRASTALFVTDGKLSAMHHSTVDTYLGHFLTLHLGAAAGNYSFHSFRIGFACALMAAGCDVYTIQALARWRSPESIRIYARMNPDVYAGWVTKSMQQRASSTTTANLPTIDRHDALTLLLADADADVDTDL